MIKCRKLIYWPLCMLLLDWPAKLGCIAFKYLDSNLPMTPSGIWLSCPAADMVDGSKVLYFEQAFWRTPHKPFRQELEWSSHGLKALFSVGGLLWLFCGAVVLSLPMDMNIFMYILSVVIGIANAFMMVTSVGIESELVDTEVEGSAFVYGSAQTCFTSFRTSHPKTLGEPLLA